MLFKTLALAALLQGIAAQIGVGVPGSSNSLYGGSRLCNHSFADANTTGIVTFNPAIAQGQQTSGSFSSPVSWAATNFQPFNAVENSSHSEFSLWISTNGVNYTDNFGLGFDACYFRLSNLLVNTVLRGQDDDGTCSSTLNKACINDLQNAASTYAIQLVGAGSASNLTANSLPGVCSSIAEKTTRNFPSSCAVFFDGPGRLSGGLPDYGGPLTGPHSLIKTSQCTSNSSFRLLWSQFEAANPGTYAIGNWVIDPLLTTFMPIADSTRPVTLSLAKSIMSCVRAKNVNSGSVIPPVAPTATPIGTAGNDTTAAPNPASATAQTGMLSGGAIAGVVIGAAAGVALLLGLFFLVRRSRVAEKDRVGQHSSTSENENSSLVDGGRHGHAAEVDGHGPMVEAPHTNGYYEMQVPLTELQEKNFEPKELPA